MDFINARTRNLKQGAIRAMFDKANSMENIISMGIGEPDMATPQVIRDAAKEALDSGFTHYTPNAGIPELRQAIANREGSRGLDYDPIGEIIITNGGMGALSLLMAVVLDPGDEVLIQDPQWLNYIAQVRYYGGVDVRIPTDAEHGFEMQPDVVEGLITPRTKALMINTPHNPTGSVTTESTLAKLADIALKHDILVVTDEVYGTLLYDGAVCHSIAEFPGMKERTVIVNSFSKAYAMTGWRIGYAAGPAEIIDKMVKCQENFSSCANAPGQYAALFASEHPELCDELKDIFAKRRRVLLDGLAGIDGIKCGKPMGAFYAFPDISGFGLDSSEFCNLLLEREGVVCIPGSAFGSCGEGYIRICYASDEDILQEALRRLRAFCSHL